SDHQQLEQLVIKARHRYTEVGESLTEKFLKHYADERFRLTGMLHQTEIFEKKVKPRIVEGKTAYVWVDALRYEMARELAETLDEEFEMEIQPALGMIPTITPIGMAALLPGAHESAAVVPANGNKLALKIGDTVLKDRNDRVKFLKDSVEVKVFATKLERLIPRPNKKIREKISDADLILITSQEIDLLAEEDNVPLTRQIMGSVLRNLQRAFRNLSELGVETIVFTADHGYLLGEELSSDMKIDAPGGDTVDLHRRIWVGRGGAADSSYLRAQLSDFGLSEDLEIATPWNFACFKVRGGSTAYFHGGLSPQELFIPVVTLKPKKAEPVGLTGEIEWKLIPGSQKISTRFFSIQVKGTTTSLLELVPPKVRIEIRVQGKSISNPVSASYGFEEATGDVQLRLVEDKPGEIEPNTITLMITEETDQKTVTGYLLDATSGTELARLEKVEMAIFI
ncbi:MAG: PglZ domain-containing protein, partial [Candidatus Bipolaricaulia bacterium]